MLYCIAEPTRGPTNLPTYLSVAVQYMLLFLLLVSVYHC